MFKKKKNTNVEKIRSFIVNILSIFLVLIIVFVYLKNNFVINMSGSIQTGIYKLYPLDNNIKRNEIVTFVVDNSMKNFMLERNYIKKETKGFIKKVAGIEGDEIIVNDDLIINGKKIRTLYKKDSLGRELPLRKGKYLLKKDEFFLLGEHERSFDSSYMGIVKRSQLKNKAEFILKF